MALITKFPRCFRYYVSITFFHSFQSNFHFLNLTFWTCSEFLLKILCDKLSRFHFHKLPYHNNKLPSCACANYAECGIVRFFLGLLNLSSKLTYRFLAVSQLFCRKYTRHKLLFPLRVITTCNLISLLKNGISPSLFPLILWQNTTNRAYVSCSVVYLAENYSKYFPIFQSLGLHIIHSFVEYFFLSVSKIFPL